MVSVERNSVSIIFYKKFLSKYGVIILYNINAFEIASVRKYMLSSGLTNVWVGYHVGWEPSCLRACSLTEPGVNFASVYGLIPVTVHMSFSLPQATLRGRLPIVQHRVNLPCRGSFSPCEQKVKVEHAHY